MMYKHLSMRRFNDSQVRFDFVITSALHLAYTVIAVSTGFTTNSGRGNYSWEEFTVYAASVFEDTYIAMGKEKLLKVCACRSIGRGAPSTYADALHSDGDEIWENRHQFEFLH